MSSVQRGSRWAGAAANVRAQLLRSAAPPCQPPPPHLCHPPAHPPTQHCYPARAALLQGHIWRQGFLRGELKGELFRDVPDALAEWRRLGIKTYIYSSGSR